MPGFTFPAVGRVGDTSPPYHPVANSGYRYYDPLRLPNAYPGFVRSSLSAPVPYPMRQAASGSPQFPSYPFENMPWSQTPVVTHTLAIAHMSLLPSTKFSASAFVPLKRYLSLRSTIIHFSGLNTEPTVLFHPASDSRLRVCPRTSLMSCWLNFAHVGLPQIDCPEPEQAPLRDLPFDPFSSAPEQALRRGAWFGHVRSPTG